MKKDRKYLPILNKSKIELMREKIKSKYLMMQSKN